MAHLRASAFFLGASIALVVIAVTGLLTAVLPFHLRYRYLTLWGRFSIWWLGLTCGLRHRVEGAEHIRPEPSVILCKHQSTWETLVLQTIFPPQVWVLKRELMWVPLFGWGLALLRPIAIDRGAGRRAVEQVARQGSERLDSGLSVVIFPEGTRVGPGRRKKWGVSGAVLAAHSGRPVVPVAHNAGYYWARREFVKRPGTIRLIVGEPIQTAGLSPEEINRRAEEWVEARMQEFEAEQRALGWKPHEEQ